MAVAKLTAQTWALRQLTYAQPARYRELYLEEKGEATGSRNNSAAQGRAKTRLCKEFRDEYRALYQSALDQGMTWNKKQTAE